MDRKRWAEICRYVRKNGRVMRFKANGKTYLISKCGVSISADSEEYDPHKLLQSYLHATISLIKSRPKNRAQYINDLNRFMLDLSSLY